MNELTPKIKYKRRTDYHDRKLKANKKMLYAIALGERKGYKFMTPNEVFVAAIGSNIGFMA